MALRMRRPWPGQGGIRIELRHGNDNTVLCQDMVSTPRAECNRYIAEDEGPNEAHVVIDLGQLLSEIGKRDLIVER